MLWNLGFLWLAMALACVTILSFALALALDALTEGEAFGVTGNTAVMTSGFFAGIWLANSLGYQLVNVREAIPVGLSGAFALFGFLVVLRAVKRRLIG